MARIVLLNIFMFLLPFLVYAAYVYFVRRGQKNKEIWRDAPILWLFAAGVILAFGMLVTLVSFTGSGPGGHYEPPRFEDGKIKPGRIE